MASERQDKDKYTHAEVRFEHPARGKNTCDECAHFIRGSLGGWHVGGCELVKDPIEPEDWCNKFNTSLVKPLKTLKLTSRLTPIAAWISPAACATFGASIQFFTHQKGGSSMKRKCAAFVIASLFVFVVLGSAWAQSDEEQLKKLETDRAAAAVKGDVATLEKQTADDYTFINLYGRMSDKSQMVNAFKTGQTKLTSNDLSDMKVRVYGDTAVITGKVDVAGTMAGKDTKAKIMFTRVYVKKGGQWQSVAFQQTRVSTP
jgi:ketosteroid isomerase-like protein